MKGLVSQLFKPTLIAGLFLLTAFGCVSRYRLDLDLYIEERRMGAKVTEANYVQRVRLGDIYAESKLELGDSNCIVLKTSSRGEAVTEDGSESPIFRIDEHLRCKLYLQLPSQPRPGSIELEENSFVQLLGRYEVPADDKIYRATAGTLVIDSIVDQKRLFGSIDGKYANRLGHEVVFRGRFKVKIAN